MTLGFVGLIALGADVVAGRIGSEMGETEETEKSYNNERLNPPFFSIEMRKLIKKKS